MGFTDIFNNLLNKGPHNREPIKADELGPVEDEFAEITKKLEHERQSREGVGKFLKHPLQVLTERPENILIVCIPLSLLVFIGGFLFMVRTYGMRVLFTSTSVDDFAVFAVLIAIIPVALLDLREQVRVTNLENALPNFFRDLAGHERFRHDPPDCRPPRGGCRIRDPHPAHTETRQRDVLGCQFR